MNHIFKIDNITISLPVSKIEEKLVVKNKLIVCLGEDLPFNFSKLDDDNVRANYVAKAWILASGIWCFDQDGQLLWKIDEVVNRKHPNVVGLNPIKDFFGTIYIGFNYDNHLNHIIGITTHGHQVRVDVETGKTISIIQGK